MGAFILSKIYFMKSSNFILFGAILLSSVHSEAQTAITMNTKGSFDNKELRELLSFYDTDYYKVNLEGALRGRNFTIVSKEIWNGRIRKIDTLFNSSQNEIFRLKSDTLRFAVMAAKTEEKKLRVRFSFDRFSVVRNYKSTKSDMYSLRDFGTQLKPEIGKSFYAFSYILPAEHSDGSSSWCEVDAAGDDVENWGKKFKIAHYLLFEMRFE